MAIQTEHILIGGLDWKGQTEVKDIMEEKATLRIRILGFRGVHTCLLLMLVIRLLYTKYIIYSCILKLYDYVHNMETFVDKCTNTNREYVYNISEPIVRPS